MSMADRHYGARPPQSVEWTIGKTAASIQFVYEAVKYISEPSVGFEETQVLVSAILDIKNDSLKFQDYITPEKYVERIMAEPPVSISVEPKGGFGAEYVQTVLRDIGAENITVISPELLSATIKKHFLWKLSGIAEVTIKPEAQLS